MGSHWKNKTAEKGKIFLREKGKIFTEGKKNIIFCGSVQYCSTVSNVFLLHSARRWSEGHSSEPLLNVVYYSKSRNILLILKCCSSSLKNKLIIDLYILNRIVLSAEC